MIRSGISTVVLIFLLAIPMQISRAQAVVDVFIIHSYDSSRTEVKRMEEGIRNAVLQQHNYPIPIQIETAYLAHNSLFTTERDLQTVSRFLVQKIEQLQPRLIILVDRVAAEIAGDLIAEYTDIPMIQVGALDPPRRPEVSDATEGQSTYVYGELPLMQNGKLWGRLQQNKQNHRGMVITDRSRYGDMLTTYVQNNGTGPDSTVNWEVKQVDNWEEFKASIRLMNYRDDIDLVYPALGSLAWEEDVRLHYSQMVEWIKEYSNKPVLGVSIYSIEEGLFGGIVQNRKKMGEQVGHVTASILKSESVSRDLLSDESAYTLSFNVQRAKVIGIDIPPSFLTAAEYLYEE